MSSEGASDATDCPRVASEFLFSTPVYDLLAFGRRMSDHRPRYHLRVWHIIVLARELGWHYPNLVRLASAATHPEDRLGLHIHRLGEQLLRVQIEGVTSKRRLFGIFPDGADDLSMTNRDERTTLARSLLATAIRHRERLLTDTRNDLYEHLLLSHGLSWAWGRVYCGGLAGGSLDTRIPELDTNEVNGVILEASGLA